MPRSRRQGLATFAALLSLVAVPTMSARQPPARPSLLGSAATYVAVYQVIRGEARYSNVRQFKGTARIKVGP